jgi:5'-deoxynucleotidase YfbR-like HD superfamily hydrolase
MTRDLEAILRSGYQRRWHSNPDIAHTAETTGHHHGQVAQIIMALHPDPSRDLIDAALHHDCGEMGLGDVSATAKRENPHLAALLDTIEARNRAAMGLHWRITRDEARWLKFADRLSAFAWMLQMTPHLAGDDEWVVAGELLRVEALSLGVADRLEWVDW